MIDIYDIIIDLSEMIDSLYERESIIVIFEDVLYKFLSFMKKTPVSGDIETLIDTRNLPLRYETRFLFDISKYLKYYLINVGNLHPMDVRFNIFPCLNIEYLENFKVLFHVCCDSIIEKFQGIQLSPNEKLFIEKILEFKENIRYLVGELRDNESLNLLDFIPPPSMIDGEPEYSELYAGYPDFIPPSWK
jgi:hypothetical protein